VSGKYGSRQEEAQRLGRVLRPKSDGRSAKFYTLVSTAPVRKTSLNIDNFLTEQGYRHLIEIATPTTTLTAKVVSLQKYFMVGLEAALIRGS